MAQPSLPLPVSWSSQIPARIPAGVDCTVFEEPDSSGRRLDSVSVAGVVGTLRVQQVTMAWFGSSGTVEWSVGAGSAVEYSN